MQIAVKLLHVIDFIKDAHQLYAVPAGYFAPSNRESGATTLLATEVD